MINNNNLKQNDLGTKKLHLSRKGNITFGKNLLNFTQELWKFQQEGDLFHEENRALNYPAAEHSDIKKDS